MESQIEMMLRGSRFKKMITDQLAEVRIKYGLRRVEAETVYYLSNCGEKNTLKDVAYHLGMNKGHISQALEKLCEQGYLIAVPDKSDRRYIHYLITDKGNLLSDEMKAVWMRMTQRIFEGVTEEQMRVLQEIASKIGENMNRILDE
ncbi:MAG: MarR family transcriptional regulator [Lachnospiraceae bacterium]|nr:MarR family transcriptional regulator [Lachnospiraceae bacterium]